MNADERRAYNAKWNRDHRERIREYQRKYRREHDRIKRAEEARRSVIATGRLPRKRYTTTIAEMEAEVERQQGEDDRAFLAGFSDGIHGARLGADLSVFPSLPDVDSVGHVLWAIATNRGTCPPWEEMESDGPAYYDDPVHERMMEPRLWAGAYTKGGLRCPPGVSRAIGEALYDTLLVEVGEVAT